MKDLSESAPAPSIRRPRHYALLLTAILLLALTLRVIGITWGLPDHAQLGEPPIHPDEAAIYSRGATLYSNPDAVTFTWGGSLYYRLSYLAGVVARFFEAPFAMSHFALTLLLLRLLNVLLGTATVAIVAALATRRIDPAVGLASGALLACFPNHVLASHYARPDILMTFLCSASLACACSLGAFGRMRQLGLGSILAGLAIATSSWGFITIPSLAVAWLLQRRTLGLSSLVALPLLVALGYSLGSFESFLFWDAFGDGFVRATEMHEVRFHFPTRLLTTVSFYAFGSVASFFAWAGLAGMLARRRQTDWIIAIYLIAGGLMLSRMGSEMIRYLLFLSPAVAIAAAASSIAAARALPFAGLPAAAREVVCVSVVVLFTLQLSATYVLAMGLREDPRYQIGSLLTAQANPGATVGITQSFYGDKSYSPRFGPGHRLRIVPLMLRADTDASGYLERPLDYVATSDFASDHARGEFAHEFFRTLRESGRFHPSLEVRAVTPPLRIAGWFGGTRPGDLMYVQSSLIVYEAAR